MQLNKNSNKKCMIKFFRKIRYDLMNQNKTTKPTFAKACASAKALGDMRSAGRYFKYAIARTETRSLGTTYW